MGETMVAPIAAEGVRNGKILDTFARAIQREAVTESIHEIICKDTFDTPVTERLFIKFLSMPSQERVTGAEAGSGSHARHSCNQWLSCL